MRYTHREVDKSSVKNIEYCHIIYIRHVIYLFFCIYIHTYMYCTKFAERVIEDTRFSHQNIDR